MRRTAVTATDHKKRGRRETEKVRDIRETRMVVKKLILPRIEETPARCNLKIARSTEMPLWNFESERGGYTVHPVPTPLSNRDERRRRVKEGIRSQNERLFIRGKAISATPNIKGSNQLPKPPMEIGITMKKIIIKAWAVTITLYKCSSASHGPIVPNSRRISKERDRPIKPAQIPKIK